MSKAVSAFVACISIAAVLSWVLPPLIPPIIYWLGAVALGAILALTLRKTSAARVFSGRGEFLCDSCKYNDPRYCSRPERPNATRCPDHRAGGFH